MQAAVTQEVVSALSSKIEEFEKTLQSGSSAEKEVAKARKKAVREVLKYVGDRSISQEDRISFLQNKYVQQVSGCQWGVGTSTGWS